MSIRTKIKAKGKAIAVAAGVNVFNEGIVNGRYVRTKAGVPSEAGNLWELCYDSTNNDVYINTDGSTTWAKIGD